MYLNSEIVVYTAAVRTIEPSSVVGLQADPAVRRRSKHQPGAIGDDFTAMCNRTLQILGYGVGEAPPAISAKVVKMLRLGKHPLDIINEMSPDFGNLGSLDGHR